MAGYHTSEIAYPPVARLALLMAMAHAAARFPSPSRPLSSSPHRPVGFHAHIVRLRRGLLVAGAIHAPTPSRSHLLASGLTLPDLATTTPSYVFQVCPRAHSINPSGVLHCVPAGTPGTTASPRAGPPRDRGSALAALPCAPAPSRGTPTHVPRSR